ncbi:MAG: HDOD domain-containing protein [Chloroflexi bacterium]|nr:HDOD domain-containing protein [Chloroflexota bacterium]MDA1240950.1 HDOD domain-containing protein [Chloroflexota bacterium]
MSLDPNPALDMMIVEIAELRPLPMVAVRVLEIAEGERFSAHELAQAIATDQALTAKVLRLSNSAYYGFPRRITTVRDAVVLLGFRAVRSATLASCVIDTLPGGEVLDPLQAWRFSVTVGLLAEVLARATKQHQDEAFTAGVIHNIGRMALDQRRPRELTAARILATQRGISIAEAQRAVFGFTDAELGGALALHWNFPDDLAKAVAGHQLDPHHLPDPRSLTAYVVRARLFARASGITDGYEGPVEDERASREWGLPPVAPALLQSGGMDGIRQKVSAFIETAGGSR